MPSPRFRVTPASVIVGGIVVAALLVAISPMARAGFQASCPASGPCPTPTPTPTPIGANIVLDIAAGGPNTKITVSGSSFLAGESMNLYWDTSSHVAGSATTDGGGNFTQTVKPFPGDSPGVHRLCVSVQPNPCANFTLQGPPTPTPPASLLPSATPTAPASPSPSSSASPLALTVNSGRGGLDVITKPPFVFLPIIGLLAVLAALAYWLLMRVDRTPVLPSASVVHRSARPDIGPGAPPPAPPTPVMQPPPADVPPPPAPFDPPTEPDAPDVSPEPPEPPAY